MKLTILGCSGSTPAPGNPASGYLITVENDESVVMDLGPGTLAALQEIQNPSSAHVVFSHLHADHCSDFPSLMVWRRFSPHAPQDRNLCYGPADTPVRMGRMIADDIDGVDDFSDTFAFSPWVEGQKEIVGRVTITPYATLHPIESYALRVEEPSTSKTLCYTGDSAWCENLITAAQDVDILFAEAGWGPTEKTDVHGMHMSGREAGRLAREANVKKLVLVHLPPWADKDATVAAAREEFDGEIVLGVPGAEFEL